MQEDQNWHWLQLQRGMRDAVTPSLPLSPRAEQPAAAGGGSDQPVPWQTDLGCAGVASCPEKHWLSLTQVSLTAAQQPEATRKFIRLVKLQGSNLIVSFFPRSLEGSSLI